MNAEDATAWGQFLAPIMGIMQNRIEHFWRRREAEPESIYAGLYRHIAAKVAGIDDATVQNALHDALHIEADRLCAHLFPATDSPPDDFQYRGEIFSGDGAMLALDSRFIDYCERQLGLSQEEADRWRERSAGRLSAYLADPTNVHGLFALWEEHHDISGSQLRWVEAGILALANVASLILPRVRAECEAKPVSLSSSYILLDKPIGAISWAYGAHVKTLEAERGEICSLPSPLSRFTSRTRVVGNRPSQLWLPIGLDELPVQTTRAILNATDSKLILYLGATARYRDGESVRATVRELAEAIYPEKSRVQARDFLEVQKSLWKIRRLSAVVMDKSLIDVQLFDVTVPVGEIDADQTVVWSMAPSFRKIAERLPALKGGFLINVRGAMELSGHGMTEFRAYIHSAGLWNDAQRQPKQIPEYSLDQWIAATNSDWAGAATYGKQLLYRARKSMLGSLECLHGQGLIILEQAGRSREKTYKALPPQDIIDAYVAIRTKKPTE